MKKSNSLWGNIIAHFAPSKSEITVERVKSDIIPLIISELEEVIDFKIFMGPMEKTPEILFTQILLNRKLTIECEENLNDQSTSITVFKKQKCLLRAILKKEEYIKSLTLMLDLIFLKVHQYGVSGLQKTIDQINSGISLNLVESEQKSREWLRVTMEVYKKALQQVACDKNLLLEFSVQLNAEEKEPFLVFKSYNLFWQMKFLENGLLRVIFYNDKEAKQQNKPSLSGDFYHQKNQIWDEFTKTLSEINRTQGEK